MRPKYPEIGKRIAEARKSRRLKQKDCRKPLGDVTIQMISSWENGHSFPSPTYLMKISQFFDLSLDYLVFGKKDNEVNKKPASYSELLNHLIFLMNSGVFSSEINSIISNELQQLNLSASDKNILDFYKKLERLQNSKDLYGISNYEIALKELINSYSEKI